jgi:iron complex outermembrane receptor protein
MTANHSVRDAVRRALPLAIKRALAGGSIALCGAGIMAAYAQQAVTVTTGAPPVVTAAKHVAKKEAAKKPLLLAQASTAQQVTPQPTTPAPAVTLQTVVVTGSLIARTSTETPNPVQVISSKDLLQSGYTDISSVLRNISANGASTLSQSFSFAFAAGASGISLRGLTVGDTLVLIDGERTIPYPLLDDNQRSFVDLASIPFTAIQNVEVDKNGASAVYGSDAIAGVVNVILRKEYEGFKTSAEVGTSERGDGTTEHLGFIGGHGELDTDGYNWYISGDFRHADQILASHRHGLWDSLDQTPWGGTFSGPNNVGQSVASDPLNAYPQSTTGYFIDPTTGTPVYYLPGCNAVQQSMNKCLSVYPGAQLQPSTSRIDLLGKFTKKLGDDWTLGLQGSWFQSSSQEIDQYPDPWTAIANDPMGGVTNLVFGPGMPLTVVPATALQTPNLITLPVTNPMYPASCNPASDPEKCSWFGSPLAFQYSFPEVGPQSVLTNTNTYRLLANLDGDVGGWRLHATGGAMYARMSYKLTGQINWQDLQAALDNGYIFGGSNATSLFAPVMETTPWSELDLLDVHGQHKLFDLPGGPVELALGMQYYKVSHDEKAPAAAQAGLQSEAGGPIFVIGTEKDAAGFVEVDGKPIKQLEIDAAGRYDSIQGVGSAMTPQVGVKFTPIHQVALRATYGKGFRAPSAAEGGASGELFGAGAFTDPVLCPTASPGTNLIGPGDYPTNCNFGATGFQTSNPHLQPVKSTNWTAGIVLQPIADISASVDYYNIKVQNDVVSAFEAGGLQNYTGIVRGSPTIQPYCPATYVDGCTTTELVSQLTPVGSVLALEYPYVNSGFTHTTGFDVDLRAHYDAGRFGRFTAEATWTHLLTYQLLAFDSSVGAPVLFELAGTHGPSGVSGDTGNPKDRGELRASWSQGPLTISPSLEFIGHFSIIDPSAGFTTCNTAIGFDAKFLNGVNSQNSQFCTVGYFLETNLYAAYQVSGKLQLHAAVNNLFNKTPPIDMTSYGSGSYFYPYDAGLEQDGAVGRFFTVGLTYDFD